MSLTAIVSAHSLEFVDARKAGFLKVKDYVENGGHVVGMFCSYTPLELFDAAGVACVGLCGTSNEPIAAAGIAAIPKKITEIKISESPR